MKNVISCAVVLSMAGVAMANTVNPGLAGTTQYDGWDGITAANYTGYGTFPGSGAWPAPIGSNQSGSGDADLSKVANGSGGGPYLASGGIYSGGFAFTPNTLGGTLGVSDSTPVANLANVVFQVEISEAFGYDLFNDVLPKLSYNGGSQNLAPSFDTIVERVQNGTFDVPGGGTEPLYINTYLVQWDLSALSGITSFSVSFNTVQHSVVSEARLDQSDSYSALTVPAPASAALVGIGGLVAIRRRRK